MEEADEAAMNSEVAAAGADLSTAIESFKTTAIETEGLETKQREQALQQAMDEVNAENPVLNP